jgi:regulator of protease activity HflC (stomatin/prohibitin superfamily)
LQDLEIAIRLILLLIFLLLVLVIAIKLLPVKLVTIYEYQKGLKYARGRYAGTLDAGQYWIITKFSYIAPVDIRPEYITIQGQEILSADGVGLRASLAAEFQVTDPNIAINKNANFRSSLYLSLQMALREIVSQAKIDTLLENRAGISTKLMELTSAKAAELG